MRKSAILPNHFYHIYNRGINRQNIFYCESDYLIFISKLKIYFRPELTSLLCYCLMPNHYHLLVSVDCEDFGKKVMLPFVTSYTKWINNRENRVGTLFQGTFKGQVIDSDESLIQVTKYIHLNPLKAGLVKNVEDWVFSSYRDYIELRNGKLVKKEFILDYFSDKADYQNFVTGNYDYLQSVIDFEE